jgi:hypothetical protein
MSYADPTGYGASSVLNALQTGLSMLGFVPGFGAIADVVNAGISAARGDYIGAGFSLAAAVPFIGDFAAAGKAIRSVTQVSRVSHSAAPVMSAARVERAVAANSAPVKYIGRLDDLKGVPRSQTLLDDLPDLGSPRANYYQNSSVLRKSLRDGYEIRDASAFRPNSELAPTLLRPDRTVGQTFLGAERLILGNKGLQPSSGGAYVPR